MISEGTAIADDLSHWRGEKSRRDPIYDNDGLMRPTSALPHSLRSRLQSSSAETSDENYGEDAGSDCVTDRATGRSADASGIGPEPATAPQTKIQVNFLNSCRPAPGDVEEMGRALARVKQRPLFAADFEVSRGLTT